MKRKSMLALLLAVSMTCSMTAATGAVAFASDDTATEETADDTEATADDADAADTEEASDDTAEASDTSFSLFPFLPCAILVFCLVFSLAITQFGKKERQ